MRNNAKPSDSIQLTKKQKKRVMKLKKLQIRQRTKRKLDFAYFHIVTSGLAFKQPYDELNYALKKWWLLSKQCAILKV